jgi:hypothetical protein
VLLDEEQAKEIGRLNLKVQEPTPPRRFAAAKRRSSEHLAAWFTKDGNCLINWKDVERRVNFQITSMKRKDGK